MLAWRVLNEHILGYSRGFGRKRTAEASARDGRRATRVVEFESSEKKSADRDPRQIAAATGFRFAIGIALV
jgi:hypothetical protein